MFDDVAEEHYVETRAARKFIETGVRGDALFAAFFACKRRRFDGRYLGEIFDGQQIRAETRADFEDYLRRVSNR